MTSPSALLLNGDSHESGTKFLGSRRLHHFFQVLYNHCEPHCATRILTDFFYFFCGGGASSLMLAECTMASSLHRASICNIFSMHVYPVLPGLPVGNNRYENIGNNCIVAFV